MTKNTGQMRPGTPVMGERLPIHDQGMLASEVARHAPMIAFIGNLYWCTCAEPDWDSPTDDQPLYEPELYAAHVVAAVLTCRATGIRQTDEETPK